MIFGQNSQTAFQVIADDIHAYLVEAAKPQTLSDIWDGLGNRYTADQIRAGLNHLSAASRIESDKDARARTFYRLAGTAAPDLSVSIQARAKPTRRAAAPAPPASRESPQTAPPPTVPRCGGKPAVDVEPVYQIIERSGPISPSQIAKAIGKSQPATDYLLGKLLSVGRIAKSGSTHQTRYRIAGTPEPTPPASRAPASTPRNARPTAGRSIERLHEKLAALQTISELLHPRFATVLLEVRKDLQQHGPTP